MTKINSLDQLNISDRHKGFLAHFLSKASTVDYISNVILFGSCAWGDIQARSDVNLLVVTKDNISLDDEFFVMYDCVPDGDDAFYLPSDVIVDPVGNYERFKNAFGMLQCAVEREGVDLSELLSYVKAIKTYIDDVCVGTIDDLENKFQQHA